ncbi:MAG: methyltransferase domain-containing protein [Planctomycetota bacterium]
MSTKLTNAGPAESVLFDSPVVRQSAQLSDRRLFFKKFLAKGREISSAVPSSGAMVSGILRHVQFGHPSTIVELGAGTGPVTERILARLRPHHRFIAVENDPDFCRVLRRKFPKLHLLESDATSLVEPFERMGLDDEVDYVISGLPTPNLTPKGMVRLWKWLRSVLSPQGVFIQITVAPLVYRGFYARLFEQVEYRMVWRNVPPGGIYRCTRPRRHLRKPA